MPSYRKFDIFSNATAQYFNPLRKGNRHWSEYFNLHHQVTMYRWCGFAVLIGRLRWQVAYGIWRYNQSVSTMKYSKELLTIGSVTSSLRFNSDRTEIWNCCVLRDGGNRTKSAKKTSQFKEENPQHRDIGVKAGLPPLRHSPMKSQ